MREIHLVVSRRAGTDVTGFSNALSVPRSLFFFGTPAPFEPPFKCDSVTNAAINYHDSRLFVSSLLIGVINGGRDATESF